MSGHLRHKSPDALKVQTYFWTLWNLISSLNLFFSEYKFGLGKIFLNILKEVSYAYQGWKNMVKNLEILLQFKITFLFEYI